MSEKIKKEKTPGKAAGKAPGKASAKPSDSVKPQEPSAEPKPSAKSKEAPAKPLVSSNNEEGGVSGSLFALLLTVIVIGGGFATQPLWSPYVVDYLPQLEKSAEIVAPEDTLVDRIDLIEKEISQVRQSGEVIADLERQRGQMNQSFEGVMARIVELEKQIDYVRGMLQATSPPADAVATNESLLRLSARMNKLEASDETVNAVMERLATLELAMADSGSNSTSTAEQLAQSMAAISERIGSLESGITQSSAGDVRAQKQVQAQTLVLAVGHLRETLRTSAPFAPALGALEALGHGDPDIMRGVNELAPFAQTGIATLDTLRRDFIATAAAIAGRSPQGEDGAPSEDVIGGVISSIKSLVTVRKAGTPVADVATGPLGTAKALLEEGNLTAAVAILSEMDGFEASAAAPWLERARARLMAETTLSRLHVFVVSLLVPVNN